MRKQQINSVIWSVWCNHTIYIYIYEKSDCDSNKPQNYCFWQVNIPTMMAIEKEMAPAKTITDTILTTASLSLLWLFLSLVPKWPVTEKYEYYYSSLNFMLYLMQILIFRQAQGVHLVFHRSKWQSRLHSGNPTLWKQSSLSEAKSPSSYFRSHSP